MVDTANSVALDLGVADVHAPAAAGKMTPVKGKSKRGAVEKKPNRKARRMAKLRLAWTHADGSTMTVRHMTDSADALHLMTELSDKDGADGKPVWIQIAKTGEFKGHPQGAFQLNESVFKQIIANFNATQNRQVAIDFEHWSESNNPLIAQVGAPAQWERQPHVPGSGALTSRLDPAHEPGTMRPMRSAGPLNSVGQKTINFIPDNEMRHDGAIE